MDGVGIYAVRDANMVEKTSFAALRQHGPQPEQLKDQLFQFGFDSQFGANAHLGAQRRIRKSSPQSSDFSGIDGWIFKSGLGPFRDLFANFRTVYVKARFFSLGRSNSWIGIKALSRSAGPITGLLTARFARFHKN